MSRSPLPMNTAQPFSSDVAFTPTVKALQTRKGSRTAYERMEEKGGWRTQITPDLKSFIEEQVSVFLATVNAERVSPTSSIAAVPQDSCACSTTEPSLLSILLVTANTSPKGISATMQRPFCFSSITRMGNG